MGSCCTRKVCLMKVPSELLKLLEEGSYEPAENWKKKFVDDFLGPITSPLKIFTDFERKWKVCLVKVSLFLLKNACEASNKPFFLYPFGAFHYRNIDQYQKVRGEMSIFLWNTIRTLCPYYVMSFWHFQFLASRRASHQTKSLTENWLVLKNVWVEIMLS